MARLYQGNFSAGELAPGLWGRVDLDRFSAGLRVCRNFFPMPEGGVVKRPGLEFIGYSLGSISADARLIPFKFNNEQTYIVVAEPNNVYFIRNGGVILQDAGVGTYTVGQTGLGTFIHDSTGNLVSDGFTLGARLFVLEGGYEEITLRWLKVGGAAHGLPAPTASDIYLIDYVTDEPLPTSGYTTNGTIDFRKIYNLGSASNWYSGVAVDELDYTQANDTLYIFHPSAKSKVLTRTADNAWTITDFDPSPSVSAPTAVEGDYAEAFAKSTGSDEVDYAITAVDNETFEESLASLLTITGLDTSTFAGPPDGSGLGAEIDVTHQSGADTYRIYKGVGGIFGIVGTVEGTSGTITFRDYGITPNLSIAPPLEVSPEFNATDEYPGAGELFQQRILLGRTNDKLRDWYASRSGSFSSFSNTTVETDSDPISQQIAARSVQEVRYFVPLRNLLILTSDGEWGLDNGEAGVLTPGSGLEAQSFWGSARVKPALIGDSAIFVERTGQSVRDLAFSLQNDGFASSNLSLLAKHLFRGRSVKAMCYAESPHQILFLVMSDGRALSCTYVRDQQIFAWARHDTAGTMLDCAAVAEDGVDNIYVHVERESSVTGSGVVVIRQIERMRMIDPLFADQGVYLDNHFPYNVPNQFDFETYDDIEAFSTIDAGLAPGFRMQLPTGVADGSIIQISAAAGTALEQLDGLVFKIDVVSPLGGGLNLVSADRVVGADTEDFDWESFFSRNVRETGVVGQLTVATDAVKYAHHLVYREGMVSVRADYTMYEEQTIPDGGQLTLAAEAGKIHLGEVYTAEIETLDIDSVEDPVTGLPLQIGSVLVRFGLAVQFTMTRKGSTNVVRTLAELKTQNDFDLQLGGFRGVFEQTVSPSWLRRGRVGIESRDGFPLQISAVVPKVQAGDFDD